MELTTLAWLKSNFRFGVFGHQNMFFSWDLRNCLEWDMSHSIRLGEVFDWCKFWLSLRTSILGCYLVIFLRNVINIDIADF